MLMEHVVYGVALLADIGDICFASDRGHSQVSRTMQLIEFCLALWLVASTLRLSSLKRKHPHMHPCVDYANLCLLSLTHCTHDIPNQYVTLSATTLQEPPWQAFQLVRSWLISMGHTLEQPLASTTFIASH